MNTNSKSVANTQAANLSAVLKRLGDDAQFYAELGDVLVNLDVLRNSTETAAALLVRDLGNKPTDSQLSDYFSTAFDAQIGEITSEKQRTAKSRILLQAVTRFGFIKPAKAEKQSKAGAKAAADKAKKAAADTKNALSSNRELILAAIDGDVTGGVAQFLANALAAAKKASKSVAVPKGLKVVGSITAATTKPKSRAKAAPKTGTNG